MPDPILEFTGERYTPECVREIRYEHMHRYAWARPLAAGRRVLDVACGEGYGSAMLADVARQVTGVDVDHAAVEHARRRYAGRENLDYCCDDAVTLASQSAASFDLITCFETLEHLQPQETLLARLSELLTDDGLLLISTPDKRTYSELAGFRNEFHVRELYREEFESMLRAEFPEVRLYGQKLLFQSVIGMERRMDSWQATTLTGEQCEDGLRYAPVYWMAACSRDPHVLAAIPDLHLFGDSEESVYAHYYHEIRKNMNAGTRILELEAEVAQLRERLAALDARR